MAFWSKSEILMKSEYQGLTNGLNRAFIRLKICIKSWFYSKAKITKEGDEFAFK